MPSLPITGGCACGAVRFEISEPLVRAMYCHCTRCQRRTGTAASASALTLPGSFRLTEGEEHVARWSPRDGSDKCFCAKCGAHLFAQPPANPDVVAVRMSAFDGDAGVRPMARQYVAYAAAWEPLPEDGLPRYDEAMS